ncbi:MAG: TraX family protein, partial [Oscillospiraceae bacterium]
MLLDHVYKVFFPFLMPIIEKLFNTNQIDSYFIILLLFGIGNATMPIFAWFVAEGCHYTHNIKAYIGRLLLFGIISEIPFQLMIKLINAEPLSLEIGLTNIMFTLALGAISCCGYQFSQDKKQHILKWCVPLACAAIAYFLKTDYDAYGVLAVFVCYIFKDKKLKLISLTSLIFLFRGIIFPITEIISDGFNFQIIIMDLI